MRKINVCDYCYWSGIRYEFVDSNECEHPHHPKENNLGFELVEE